MLTRKVCLVTGAVGGIGRETAIGMARRGARPVVADRDTTGAAETARTMEAVGGEGVSLACDVRSDADVEAAARGAAQRYRGIDVLHNARITESNGDLASAGGDGAAMSHVTSIFRPIDVCDGHGAWHPEREGT